MIGPGRLLREVVDVLALSPKLLCHPHLWDVARRYGEDGDLEARAAQALSRLPPGFFTPEPQLVSHTKLRPLVRECSVEEIRLRLQLLSKRGLLKVKRANGERLYRLSP